MEKWETDPEEHKQISAYLVEIVEIEAANGKDSTTEEKRVSGSKIQDLEFKIKQIDESFFDVITANKHQQRTPETVEWLLKQEINTGKK